MIILARERIKFSQKNLENKEIYEQLATFSYFNLDTGDFRNFRNYS